MSNLAKTFRTIRHLRLSQLYWRLRYRYQSGRPVVTPGVPGTPVAREDFPQGATGVPPVLMEQGYGQDARGTDTDEQLVEQLEHGRFVHLNEARELGTDPVDWRLGRRDSDRLWIITLHYHAWAWRLARLVRDGGELGRRADRLLRRYLGDWITRCDLTVDAARPLAWNAYAVATRIGWWCRLYHLLGRQGRQSWAALEPVFLESLWSQASYLENHLERDVRANHLLRDAVGLAWAGRFFEGPRPRRWLQTAAGLAAGQADEQVLPDGGHFERSPMYHVEVMEDLLTLSALLEDNDAQQHMKETWRRMAEFLVWVRHPDGRVPLLGDGGFNGTCTPAAMFAKGKELLGIDIDTSLPSGGRWFEDFGLAVWHGRPWSVFFDVGPVGVDYQPGHAHADTLTFEASYNGHRVFVDPGTLRYDNDDSRRYDRATASHNTVCLDETDSSEVWHIFRVGRRARPVDVRFEGRADGMTAAAGHTGYDHLRGRPRHRRELQVDNLGVLVITDRFEGRGRHYIKGGLLLAPEWEAVEVHNGWQLRRERNMIEVAIDAPKAIRPGLQEVAYHPEYGLEKPTRRICWEGELEFPNETILRVVPREPA